MKDSQLLFDIYKRFLQISSDLITILERHYEKLNNGDSAQMKEKRIEFVKHAQKSISKFHEDYHILFKLAWEIKDLDEINREEK